MMVTVWLLLYVIFELAPDLSLGWFLGIILAIAVDVLIGLMK